MAETRRNLHTHTHTHTHTQIVFACLISIFNFCAYGADTNISQQIAEKEEIVRQLKDEISQIDSEMARCQKAKKGWVAATVIGGVGVVATGTAAVVQTVKANKDSKDKKSTDATTEQKQ